MKLLVVAGGSYVVKVAIGEMELHDASERTVIIDSSRYHHLCSRICMLCVVVSRGRGCTYLMYVHVRSFRSECYVRTYRTTFT